MAKKATAREVVSGIEHAKAVEALPAPKYEVAHKGDETRIWSISSEIRTLDDAIAKAEIDLDLFEIKECVVNQYQVPMKLKEGETTTVHREVLWQVKVTLRRKVAQWLTDGIEAVHDRFRQHSPKYKGLSRLKKLKDPHLYEVSIFDHHFGKYAWQVETGNNYDLKIAANIYKTAFADLLARATAFEIDRFLLPLGNDMLHFDNSQQTTTAGTSMGDSSDSRYAKVFETAFAVLVEQIDVLIARAPVDIVLVAGNHDKHAAYHLCYALRQFYRNTSRVTIDTDWRKRKYIHYGCNLLGFAHGDAIRDRWARLPTLMATEEPEKWAATTHREFHLGHVHHKAKREFLPVQEHEGVVVRTLPSLTATDAWHYEHGYTSGRAAEAYLYSLHDGYVGHFSVNANTS